MLKGASDNNYEAEDTQGVDYLGFVSSFKFFISLLHCSVLVNKLGDAFERENKASYGPNGSMTTPLLNASQFKHYCRKKLCKSNCDLQ